MSVFLQDLIYLTIQEYKDSSTSALAGLSNNEIQIIIGKAEDRIKAKITYTIPELIADVDPEIKKAVVLLTDCLYKVENQIDYTGKQIVAEKDETESRTYEIIGNKTSEECMSGDVATILEPFIIKKTNRTFRT